MNFSGKRLQLINCGGTIDKTYNPAREVFEHTHTHMDQILSQARVERMGISVQELFLKDSLDMTSGDFHLLVEACTVSEYERIMVMHGTSKMVESAWKVAERNLDKTIVFFGAMMPYELAQSDAMFNFGFALSAVQQLSHGVYVAMNGQVFLYDSVAKNEIEAVFENSQKFVSSDSPLEYVKR